MGFRYYNGRQDWGGRFDWNGWSGNRGDGDSDGGGRGWSRGWFRNRDERDTDTTEPADTPAQVPEDDVTTPEIEPDPVVPVDDLPAPTNSAPKIILKDGSGKVTLNPLSNATFDVIDAEDEDGDSFVFSFSGEDADNFVINSATGEIALRASRDDDDDDGVGNGDGNGNGSWTGKDKDNFGATVSELAETYAGENLGQLVSELAKNGHKVSDVLDHLGESYELTVSVTDEFGAMDTVQLEVEILALF